MAGAPYDPVELRGRIVVCFSAQELRALADALGVAAIAWDRGAQDAARDLVRHFERMDALPVLVAELRRARPLVEWPEPLREAPAGEFTELADLERDSSVPPPPPPTAPGMLTPGRLGPPATPPNAFGGTPAEPAAPSSGRGGAAGPRWPGVVAPAPGQAPSRGVDPRILLAVGAMTVVAAVIAFVAGRASSGPATASNQAATAAAPASEEPPPRRREDGPAVRASDAFARSLANLGRACELPRTESDVLRGALAHCGPRAAPAQPVVAIPPADSAELPTSSAQDDAQGPRAIPTTPEPALPAVGSPCVSACDATRRACDGRCGPEPKHSSEYGDHQQCLAKCLAAASKCRIACGGAKR